MLFFIFIEHKHQITDWPQLPPLANNDESDESEDLEADDSIQDHKPRQVIPLSLIYIISISIRMHVVLMY